MTPEEGHSALEKFALVTLLLERGGTLAIPLSEVEARLQEVSQWYLCTMIRDGGFTFKLVSRARSEELQMAGWKLLT